MRTVVRSSKKSVIVGVIQPAESTEKEKEEAKPDDYFSQIIKYIPSEAVALYITLYGFVVAAKTQIPFETILWIIFILGVVGTPSYLWRITKVKDKTQLAISTIAFVVWVFALGGPFANLSWYNTVYGSIVLVAYTFFVPIIRGT
jgi:heme/copper-type cytochrome/quinol oxidase subunit 4